MLFLSLSVSRKISKKMKTSTVREYGLRHSGKYTFSDGTPSHIRIHFIFITNKYIGLHFPTNDIGLSLSKFFWWVPEFLFTLAKGSFPKFKASKVTDIGTNRKRGYDFLLLLIVT